MRPAGPVSDYVCFWIGETEKGLQLWGGVVNRRGLDVPQKKPQWWKPLSLFLMRIGALKHKWHRT